MKLFVYGTLQSSFDNEMAVFLRSNATLLCNGTVNGKLFLLGWYPGLFLEDNGEKVYGQIYDVYQNKDQVMERLDEYEGIETCDFRRVIASIDSKFGPIDCWLYESLIDSEVVIESGKFVSRSGN